MRMASHIFLKLNQFSSSIQSPASSPIDILNIILLQLNEWLSAIPNLFHSLVDKFDEAFPPETREHWLSGATPFVIAGLGVVLLYLFFCCYLPAIIRCIAWVVAAVWRLISGFFRLLLGMCKRVFSCCCCCGRRSWRMMKAPGRGGRVMRRASFENNPRDYFRDLRAGRPV